MSDRAVLTSSIIIALSICYLGLCIYQGASKIDLDVIIKAPGVEVVIEKD